MALYLYAAAMAGSAVWLLCRKKQVAPLLGLMTVVLPFAVGGFYGYIAGTAAAVLAMALCSRVRCQDGLQVSFDLTSAALAAVLLSVGLSPLWAQDQGMAIFSLLRWLPAALYWLYLCQWKDKQRAQALDLIPLCGGAMVISSVVLLPFFPQQLTVNGRLAGFFQYPNTFAAFLLAGYLLSAGRQRLKRREYLLLLLLAWGIVLSGSRTAFCLLVLGSVGMGLVKKDWHRAALLIMTILGGMALGHGVQMLGLLSQADRYQQLTEGGTFFARLLYWQDALPLIGRNPLGIGYLGWRSLQGSVQTGRYATAYLHNGLLQLALDAGWLPAGLIAAALLRGIVCKEQTPEGRLLLAVLCLYCLVDFHTEYLIIWVILLSLLPKSRGKSVTLHRKGLTNGLLALVAAVCLWLGTAEGLYYSGNVDACLVLTPFHTDAVEAKLAWSEPEQQLPLADRLLSLDDHRSRGWNTKAWAARDRGDWETMIAMKEKAIACDRYNEDQYLDYVNCLYYAMQTCLESGENAAAWEMAEGILSVSSMMEERNEGISSLAEATGDKTILTLPAGYETLFSQLAAATAAKS